MARVEAGDRPRTEACAPQRHARLLTKQREWYQANRERARQYSQDWAKANPEHYREINRNRLARERGAGGEGLPHWLELDWLLAYGRQCVYCSTPLADETCGAAPKFTVDHVHPLALGGDHALENLVPACLHCNSSKGDSPLATWRPDLAEALPNRAAQIAAWLRTLLDDEPESGK